VGADREVGGAGRAAGMGEGVGWRGEARCEEAPGAEPQTKVRCRIWGGTLRGCAAIGEARREGSCYGGGLGPERDMRPCEACRCGLGTGYAVCEYAQMGMWEREIHVMRMLWYFVVTTGLSLKPFRFISLLQVHAKSILNSYRFHIRCSPWSLRMMKYAHFRPVPCIHSKALVMACVGLRNSSTCGFLKGIVIVSRT